MKRRATAVWQGTGLEGSGRLSTHSGALAELPYSTAMRFQDEEGRSGTNPEELIAAAHAACFTMKLSFDVVTAGFTPAELHTDAVVTMEKEADGTGWTIRSSHLTVRARVPGMAPETFHQVAEKSKAECPVSRALGHIDISLDTHLDG
jgi:lipoyl-dependent peroxiredoxin